MNRARNRAINIGAKAVLFGGIFLLLFSMIPAARAGEVSNQATQVTFSEPVRIPGHTLPAGTYWFTVMDEGATADNLNVVRISNADDTKTIATLNTETSDKTQNGQEARVNGVTWPTGKVVFTFAEAAKNEPMSLVDWYYPGKPDGHRFRYSDREQKQIDEERHQTFAFDPKTSITIGRSEASFK